MTKKIELSADTNGREPFLIVYGREECHLCQDMVAALYELQQQAAFTFQLVDIDSDPGLIARYGEKIPVLVSSLTHQEICHYHLDVAVLGAYLDEFR